MRANSFGWALGVGLLAVGLGLVIPATPTHAQGRENCPDGFTWERTSGQCCVQDRTTIPPHGKIGYTGNSLCEDGWYEVYDRRPTTNGEGPPGCPGYTSFVFLLECDSSPEEAQRRQAEVDAAAAGSMFSPPSSTESSGGSGINSLSESLYSSGGMPSPNDLALAGGAAAALLATLGLSTLRGSGGTVRDRLTRDLMSQLKGNERQLEEAQRAVDRAREEREALRRQRSEMEAAAERMRSQLDLLTLQMQRCDANIDIANKGKYALFALGLFAAVASLEASLPVAGAAALADVDAFALAVQKFLTTVETGGGGLLHGLLGAEWQRLKNAAATAKTNAVLVRERTLEHLKDLNREYDSANTRLEDAIKHADEVRAQGARISQQMASP